MTGRANIRTCVLCITFTFREHAYLNIIYCSEEISIYFINNDLNYVQSDDRYKIYKPCADSSYNNDTVYLTHYTLDASSLLHTIALNPIIIKPFSGHMI